MSTRNLGAAWLRDSRSPAEIADSRHMREQASKASAIERAERMQWPTPHEVAIQLPRCITYSSRMGIARARITRAKQRQREQQQQQQLKATRKAARKGIQS